MSSIRMFRVNANDNVVGGEGVEIYFKVETDVGELGPTFCVDDDGIYYYRPRSRVMTPGETKDTRGTCDGFLSMDTLEDLFEALLKGLGAGHMGNLRIVAKKDGRVILSKLRLIDIQRDLKKMMEE